MNGSNSLEEAETKPFLLCPVCLRKFQSVLGFDYIERYKQLFSVMSSYKGKYFEKTSSQYQNLINEIEE